MAYRIAVCDDDGDAAGYEAGLAMAWSAETGREATVDTFLSPDELLSRFDEEGGWEILLIDVEMSGFLLPDGVALAKKIREKSERAQIIFVTGYSDYIAEGYEVSALNYLMKPLGREKLFETLERAAAKLKLEEKTLLIENSDETVRLPLREIRFIEVRQNYVTIHAKEDYTARRTLGDIEKELDRRFFRAGRSFIVNLTKIRRVSKTEVLLADGSSIPLPRGMYGPLNRAIIDRM